MCIRQCDYAPNVDALPARLETYGNISAGATPDGNLDARTMHDGDALSPVTCLVCLHRLMKSFRDNLIFS
jgi:hypothetical protein